MPFANVSSPGKVVGECWSNVSSLGKVVGEWRANVSSPAKMVEMAILASTRIRQTGEFSANFRRVLEFDKFAGEWPLLNLYPKIKLTIYERQAREDI